MLYWVDQYSASRGIYRSSVDSPSSEALITGNAKDLWLSTLTIDFTGIYSDDAGIRLSYSVFVALIRLPENLHIYCKLKVEMLLLDDWYVDT